MNTFSAVVISILVLAFSVPSYARPAPMCSWISNFQDLSDHPVDAPIPSDAVGTEIGGDMSLCSGLNLLVSVFDAAEQPVEGELLTPPGSDRPIWRAAAPLAPASVYRVDVLLNSDMGPENLSFSVTTSSDTLAVPAVDWDNLSLSEYRKTTSECCMPEDCFDPRCELCWPTNYDYLPQLQLALSGFPLGLMYPSFYLSVSSADEQGEVATLQTVESQFFLTAPRALSFPWCVEAELRFAADDTVATTLEKHCFEESELQPIEHQPVPEPPANPCGASVEDDLDQGDLADVDPLDFDDQISGELSELGPEPDQNEELAPSSSSDSGCGCQLAQQASPASPLALLGFLGMLLWLRHRKLG
jgi:hypothetical protein